MNAQAGRLEVVDPTEDPQWDEWVRRHSLATFFHGSAWAEVLKRTYGHQPVYLTAHDRADGPVVWPVMELSSVFTGRRGVSLPFTDRCEPLTDPAVGAGEMLSTGMEMGRSRGWRYFEFRGGQEVFPDLKPACSFYVHTLPLCEDTDVLFGRCRGSVRQAVRKAKQSGLRVEISRSEEGVRAYHRLHCQTRRRHGLPPQPYSFFRNIQHCVLAGGQGLVVTAWHENVAVAAAIFFHQGPEAVYKFGASDETWQHLRGNNLVMWAGIEHFARQGCRTLCFGRTSMSNEGLRHYKLGWGTEEREHQYFRYDFRANAFVQDPDRAVGWYNSVFRALPLWVSRWIGAVLHRHWA